MIIALCGFSVEIDDDDYERISSLRWRLRSGDFNKYGKVYFDHSTYIKRGEYESISLHRFIIGRKYKDGITVDHINGNTLDNRKTNLRSCSNTENCRNCHKPINNTSGYKGVVFIPKYNKWQAQIKVNGNPLYLGWHESPQQAYEAYCEASKKYHGDFGRIQ